MVAQTTDHIKVKVSGPVWTSLKKFLESSLSQSITLDISQKGEGVVYVDIPLNKIDVPLGVKILGVRPNQIQSRSCGKRKARHVTNKRSLKWKKKSTKLFGTDGIRGTANQWPMTPEMVVKIRISAVGYILQTQEHTSPGSRKVVIGKDTRLSGYID